MEETNPKKPNLAAPLEEDDAPASIHSDNRKSYTVFTDIEPTPIADWAVDRTRVNGVREKDLGARLRAVHEDFDFGRFVECGDWASSLPLGTYCKRAEDATEAAERKLLGGI
ncbi:MAG TPA: hypothetical protein VIH76_07415 [Candidatus Acidoferrales bacterium]